MNWLAHVYLSDPDVEMRLGNLLADVVRGKERERMTPRFLRGVACHQSIDAFADYHPVSGRTRARVRGEYGRASGILVDVFYDHCLARTWDRFCPLGLEQFSKGFYAAAAPHAAGLPEQARDLVEVLIAEQRLAAYREHAGVEAALEAIAGRLRERVGTDFGLPGAAEDLRRDYAAVEADFLEFFPALQAHVAAWLAARC